MTLKARMILRIMNRLEATNKYEIYRWIREKHAYYPRGGNIFES